MSESLRKTSLKFISTFFQTESDQGLSTTLSWILLILIGLEIVSGFQAPTPYGKAGKVGSGFWSYPLSPRFVWKVGFWPWLFLPWALIFWAESPGLGNSVVFGVYYLHYLNRSLIYSAKISSSASTVPFWFFGTILAGTTFNSFYQTHHLFYVLRPMGIDPLVGLGLLLAGIGAWINITHDGILAKLREGGGSGRGYKIPRGKLFEWVSCANYTGEILEFWGLALCTRAIPQVLMAVLTTVFLGLRARHTHHFYRKEFGKKYPSERKAIIPLVF